MNHEMDIFAEVARKAVGVALSHARARFGESLHTSIKGARGDLVTSVDYECEKLIVECINQSLPHHGIIGEENGEAFSGEEYVWLVDPLDGTNNYAHGIPVYGSCVTLCASGEPILSVMGEGGSGATVVAIKGRGVLLDGSPVVIRPAFTELHEVMPTSALWNGYDCDWGRGLSEVVGVLNKNSRRVFSNWAPTTDVFLCLRGVVDTVAVYECSGYELLGCLLAIREAGGEIVGRKGVHVSLGSPMPDLVFAGSATSNAWFVKHYSAS